MDDDSDNHDGGTEEDTVATTETIAKHHDEEGAEEAADGVDGSNEPFVGAVAVDLGEVVDEGRGRDDAGHDTLIVPEEQEISRGNGRDHPLELLAGGAPVGGHSGLIVFSTSANHFGETRALDGGG